MNWQNLQRNKCPKCCKELDFVSDKEMMMCSISCGFMISTQRMGEIVSEQISRRITRDNQQELNNL